MPRAHEKQKKIERTNKSAAFYRRVFGEVIASDNVQTILDVGAGDSDFAESVVQQGKSVERIDFDYATNPPVGENWEAADATDLGDFRGKYDVVVSSFMMQHLDQKDQAKALQEMIGATVNNEGYRGVTAVYPVYKGNKLREQLEKAGFSDVAIVADTGANSAVELSLQEEHLAVYSTLYIVNNKELDDERKKTLTELIATSNALTRRKTMRDMARRAFMKPGVNTVAR